MTVAFLVFYVLMSAGKNVATNIVMPMIPDAADYEIYRSGRYVPGMMSTLFSFVDKMVSSFSAAIVGVFVSFIGFKTALPTEDTPYSSSIFAVTLILYFGFPIFGWICTLIAMKFYPLTEPKMREVQSKIAGLKQQEAAN